MRIAISGASNSGKSTLINSFLRRWPMYSTPMKSYRDILKEHNLEHSTKTNEETQLLILDSMMKVQEGFKSTDNIIFDRCTWDNLAYTLVANSYEQVSDEVTAASISFVKESMKDIDIIFWLEYDSDIKVLDNGTRDTNTDYIKEVDGVFKQLYEHYSNDLETDIFYPKEDCPAIIPVEGKTVDDRIFYISQFIDDTGRLIEPDSSLFSEENLQILEQMLTDQTKAKNDDAEVINLMKEISKFKK
jgi:predicted ATPase